jgi:hypothetical protein
MFCFLKEKMWHVFPGNGGTRDKDDEEGDGSHGATHASVSQAIPPTKAIAI